MNHPTNHLFTVLAGMTLAVLSSTALAAQENFDPKGKPPSGHTIKVLKEARATLPFADKRDFEEQKRGFIAAPASKKIMADAGHVAWDLERFEFLLESDEFDSIHPSLVRQSLLNMNYRLYEVIHGRRIGNPMAISRNTAANTRGRTVGNKPASLIESGRSKGKIVLEGLS